MHCCYLTRSCFVMPSVFLTRSACMVRSIVLTRSGHLVRSEGLTRSALVVRSKGLTSLGSMVLLLPHDSFVACVAFGFSDSFVNHGSLTLFDSLT